MSLEPRGIQLGPVIIGYFGLILIAAMAAGAMIAYRRVRQHGQDPDLLWDLLTWGLVAGIVIGRLFFIWNPPPSVEAIADRRWYLTHPFDLAIGPLAIWSGGFGTAGALLGALFGAWIVLRRKHVDAWLWADIVAPGALVGIAIASFANIANQQMYGPPTTLPWGIPISGPVAPYNALSPETRFHPTPIYVAVWSLVTLGITLWIEARRRLPKGALFVVSALILMPGLFLADFLRADVARPMLGLSGMQLLAMMLFAAAAVVLVRRRRVLPAGQGGTSSEGSMPAAESE